MSPLTRPADAVHRDDVAGGPPGAGRRAMARLAGCVVVGALALGACSNETAVPDARVSVKQQALAQARTDAAAAAAHFCTTAADYVTAVDRYGDVLTATAPTVGDVQTAGTDLEQPRADATAAAQAAVDAQAAVVTAEKELAAAQAAAAAANTTAAGSSSSATSPTPSPAPTVPPATVNRVKQAETEFTAAQQGISAQTPLRQAAQQFNAAAVALEMSWLALFADAGCLTDEAEKSAQKAVHDYTAALQQSLSDTGYFSGKVDGVYGPSTVDAVQALQKAHGLPVTGTVDKATQEALQSDLQAKGGAAAQEELASTAAVQQTLKLAGFWDGPVDGRWTPALTEALKEFQTELDVPATGTVDAATIAALEKAIAEAGKPTPSPTPSRSATSTAPEPSASTPKASTQT
ncbi:peptidoglycan-binding protein [Terrabacter sp. Root181]|uniref:peptidoglycan-binding domain-containing protein n=1 Tax=Terrabacter sp. Root181 TaxID=1736484 RepID=UPI0006FA225F|nr:peptidoglycan-binding protein [Terrabacter sp. Root181]KRB43224.1 peptidoglycan-binding protein [Terrabacter sp. Root181]